MTKGKINNDVVKARIETDAAILAFRETQIPFMNTYDIYKHNRRKAENQAEMEAINEAIKNEKKKKGKKK